MVKAKVITLLCALLPIVAAAQDFQWKLNVMDGSRTGVTVPDATNVESAIGKVKCCTYTAPNGKIYRGGTVGKVAKIVTDAQPAMASMKQVIAYAPQAMERSYPESALTNWFVDNLMEAVEEASGRKVDVGIGNFGGVRLDMPQGNVILDDIRSMFPFRNDIVYVSLKGKDLRYILDNMAARHFEVLGGVKIVAKNKKIVSVNVGGKPLNDNKIYGVATISFLLDGGDRIAVAKDALEVVCFDEDIFTAMMKQIRKAAKGDELPVIEGHTDGRIVIVSDRSVKGEVL